MMKTCQISPFESRTDVIRLDAASGSVSLRVKHPDLNCQWQLMWEPRQTTMFIGDLRNMDSLLAPERAYDLTQWRYLLVKQGEGHGKRLFQFAIDKSRNVIVQPVDTNGVAVPNFQTKYFD